MLEIIDFTDYPQKFERTYGGASGRKYKIKTSLSSPAICLGSDLKKWVKSVYRKDLSIWKLCKR